jgi:hypothetical protein
MMEFSCIKREKYGPAPETGQSVIPDGPHSGSSWGRFKRWFAGVEAHAEVRLELPVDPVLQAMPCSSQAGQTRSRHDQIGARLTARKPGAEPGLLGCSQPVEPANQEHPTPQVPVRLQLANQPESICPAKQRTG